MERWEDEQLHTLEVALGLTPGTITAADIAYLIQKSCAEYDDYSEEDDDLCSSMQHCQIGGASPGASKPYGDRSSRRKSSSSSSSSKSSSSSSHHSNGSGTGLSSSRSDKKRTSRSTEKAEKSRHSHHHRRK